MAEQEASLVIRLKDLASKGLDSLKGSLDGVRKGYLAVAAGVGVFLAFAKQAIDAASEQEEAEKKLEVALRNQGETRESVKRGLVDYAGELQKTTTFADDVLIQNQAMLVSFGMLGDELKGGLRAAMDLSVARNIDLATASMLVGKAYQGNTETLKRYGIEVSSTVPESQKFKAVLDAINGSFGGSAKAAADTYAGRLVVLKNAFSDLKERIGFDLMPAAKSLIDDLKGIVEWGEKAYTKLRQIAGLNLYDAKNSDEAALAMLRERIKTLAAERQELRSGDPAKMARLQGIDEEIVRTHNLIRALEKKAAAQKEADGDDSGKEKTTPKSDEEIKADAKNAEELLKHRETLAQKAQDAIESAVLTEEALDEIRSKRLENELRAIGMVKEADQVAIAQKLESEQAANAKRIEAEKATHAARLAAANSALTALASLQNSKNKEMAAVGKAAATTQTMIATIVASMEAYKALAGIPLIGPALGAAAAASIMTAGTAKVAQINGMPLAEGGMVLPTAGGTLATIGEAGGREAVLPLDNPASMEAIREALGGSGGGITIQAGVIVADDVSLEELARRIDAKLYSLRRNRGSAFGD